MRETAPTSIDSSRTAIGPYQIVRGIGRGATGTVYLARAENGSEVAVKVLQSGAADEAFERFSREVSVAQSLVHRHVVRVCDSGADEGVPYFVMEVLHGKSLRDLLKEHPTGLDVETAVDVVAQLCLGLHHAHEHGLVHRDVKPANVFMTEEGVAKVLDFGVAKLSDTTVTADGSLVGTLAYMAPEQLNADAPIDGRADVFSAAVVLYELLTGQRPFTADSTAAMLARIAHDDPAPIPQSAELDAIVRKALQKDPADRQASAQELAYDLWTALLAPRSAEGAHPVKPFDTIYSNTPLEEEPSEIQEEPSLVAESMPLHEIPFEGPSVAPVSPVPAVEIGERGRTMPKWTYAAGAVLLASVVVAGAMLRNRTSAEGPASNSQSSTSSADVPSTSAATLAAPATSASLSVDSIPSGVPVVSEGLSLGRTPVQVTLRVGQTLLLEHAGYEPARYTIDAATLAAGRLFVPLTPLPQVR